MEVKELGSSPGINDDKFPHIKQPEGSYLCYAACVCMLGNYYNSTYMKEQEHTLHTISEWYCGKEDEHSKRPQELPECSQRPQDLADPNWLKVHNIAELGPISSGGSIGKRNTKSFTSQVKLLNEIKTQIDSEQPVILRLDPNGDAHYVCVYGYEKKEDNWKLLVSDPVKSDPTITKEYKCDKNFQLLQDDNRVSVSSPGNGDAEEERAIIGFYTTQKINMPGKKKIRKKSHKKTLSRKKSKRIRPSTRRSRRRSRRYRRRSRRLTKRRRLQRGEGEGEGEGEVPHPMTRAQKQNVGQHAFESAKHVAAEQAKRREVVGQHHPTVPPLVKLEHIAKMHGHTKTVYSACFSRDLKSYALENGLSFVQVRGKSDDQIRELLRAAGIAQPEIERNGRVLSASGDMKVIMWTEDRGSWSIKKTFQHGNIVYSAQFSPDEKHILTACGDGYVRIWDVKSGKVLHELEHPFPVKSAQYDPEAMHIVSACRESVYIWGISQPASQGGLQGMSDDSPRWSKKMILVPETSNPTPPIVNSVQFSPDGKHILTACGDGYVRIWDVKSGKVLHELEHTFPVKSAQYDTEAMHIVSACLGSILIWEMNDDSPRWSKKKILVPKTSNPTPPTVNSVQFSPDGKHIVSGGRDNIVRVWSVNPKDGEWSAQSLKGHRSWVMSVRFSPDGQRIVSASQDQTVRMWGFGYTPLGQAPPTDQGLVEFLGNETVGDSGLRGAISYKQY